MIREVEGAQLFDVFSFWLVWQELRRQEEAERKAKRDAMLAKRGGVSRTASVESSSGVAREKKDEEEKRRKEEEEAEERRREEVEAEERRREEEEQRRKEGLEALEAIVRERQAAAARANNRRQVSKCSMICSKLIPFGAGSRINVI
jgi:dTMP kinase